jgi:phenylalanyl-tRNA synthetase beta chain
MFDLKGRIREVMTGFGFCEVVSYSFISDKACDGMDILHTTGRLDPISVLNPLAADQSVMRTSLIPGLLMTMRHNLSQQINDMMLFETGRVFWKKGGGDDLPEEPEMVAALLTGAARRRSWRRPEEPVDFFDIKGALECLLKALGAATCSFTAMPAEQCTITRTGHTARVIVDGVEVGIAGEVSRAVLERFDLKKPAFIFELNVSAARPFLSDHKEARVLSRFPSVARDITIVVDQGAEAEQVLNFLEESGDNLIENIEVLDVYEGGAIPSGKKSLSFRIVYRSQEATLKDEFVNRIHARIADRLVNAFSAEPPV